MPKGIPNNPETAKKRGGFATMDPERMRQIASMGGLAAHKAGRAHQWTSEEAKAAGRKAAQARAAKRAKQKEQ